MTHPLRRARLVRASFAVSVLCTTSALLAPGVSHADQYVSVELQSSVRLTLPTAPPGRWYADYANGSSCWVTAPDGTALDPYWGDTPLDTSGVCHTASRSSYQLTFTPRDPGDLGRWTVTCLAEHVPVGQCGPAGNVCGYNCTDYPDSDSVTETWYVDVNPSVPVLTIFADDTGDPLDTHLGLALGASIPLRVEPFDPLFTYSWNVREPSGAMRYGVSTGDRFTFVGERLHEWVVSVNATGFGRTSSAYVVIDVENRPPETNLVGPIEIDAGDDLVVETTVLRDADGGDLTFAWEPVQVPNAGLPLLTGVALDEARLVIPTDATAAGTWSFVLFACDDEGECVPSSRWDVLVDGPPRADIASAPSVVTPLDFPLVLDASGSVDTDADCSVDALCDHWLAPGFPLSYMETVVRHRWFVDGQAASTALRVVDDRSTLVVEHDDIEPGHYAFRVAVDDYEGNVDEAWHYVEVRGLDLPPVAKLSAPKRYLTDVDGYLSTPVVIDGGDSFDPDDVLGPSPSADLGIVRHEWRVTPPSPTCPEPTFGDTTTITPVPVGYVLPECLGTWHVELTVTDVDGDTGTGETRFIIGNCAGDVCIDYPTGDNRAEIGVGSVVDVQIYYHLDPSVYEALPYGFYTQVDIVPSTGSASIFTMTDSSAYTAGPGSILTFYWNGYANVGPAAHTPAPTGQYDVHVAVVDAATGTVAYAAAERLAIVYENAELLPQPSTDRYVARDALDARTDRFDFEVSLAGSLGVDTWRWVVRAKGGAVATTRVVSSTSTSLSDSWDGRSGSLLQPPGEYTLEVEAYRDAYLLATVAVPLVIYDLRAEPVGGGDRLRLALNADDDDGDTIVDVVDRAIAGEDDLRGVRLTMEPPIPGTATLVPSASVALHVDDAKADACSPCDFVVSTSPLDEVVYVEGVTPGGGELVLELETDEGVRLAPFTLPTDVVHIELLDAAGLPTSSLRAGLWDEGYELDAHGATGTLLNWGYLNFIDRDDHRFYARLTDPAGDADPATRDVVTVRLGTLVSYPYTGAPSYSDPLTEVPLLETAVDSGVFESMSQLLTSNDDLINPDDEHPTVFPDDSFAVDEDRGDRTHRVGWDTIGYLGGGVRVEYDDGGGAPSVASEVSVCHPDERRRVRVHATIALEPFDDTGYLDSSGVVQTGHVGAFDFEDLDGDGQHDTDEPSDAYLDLSHDPSGSAVQGGGAMPPRDGRGPVATTAYVEAEVRRANMAWAPACIHVELASVTTSDMPPQDRDPAVFTIDGSHDELMDVRSQYFLAPITDLYLVVPGPNVEFVSSLTGTTSPVLGYTSMPSGFYSDTVVVVLASGLPIGARTFAHELGHALTNRPEPLYLTAQWLFFPGPFTGEDDAIERNRRMTRATRDNARTEWDATSAYTDPGNHLLHPY